MLKRERSTPWFGSNRWVISPVSGVPNFPRSFRELISGRREILERQLIALHIKRLRGVSAAAAEVREVKEEEGEGGKRRRISLIAAAVAGAISYPNRWHRGSASNNTAENWEKLRSRVITRPFRL